MSLAGLSPPAEYEAELQRYLFERAEEGRAVRVGEKEVSERAEIVARYRDLFTRDQLDALKDAETGLNGSERERVYRLRKTCEAGLVDIELSEREDAFENAVLAKRIEFQDEEMPLRSAQARLAVMPGYEDREGLGTLYGDASAGFNGRRLPLPRARREPPAEFNGERFALPSAREELDAELSGEADPVVRNEEEKGISLRELSEVLGDTSTAANDVYRVLSSRWFRSEEH